MFAIGLRGGIFITSISASSHGAEGRQQVVEQRDRGVRIDGGAFAEGFFPPGLKGCRQVLCRATTRTPSLIWRLLCVRLFSGTR